MIAGKNYAFGLDNHTRSGPLSLRAGRIQPVPPAFVATVCLLILMSRIADKWWQVLPEFQNSGALWVDVAAILALGGLMLLLGLFYSVKFRPGREN